MWMLPKFSSISEVGERMFHCSDFGSSVRMLKLLGESSRDGVFERDCEGEVPCSKKKKKKREKHR